MTVKGIEVRHEGLLLVPSRAATSHNVIAVHNTITLASRIPTRERAAAIRRETRWNLPR